MRDGGENYIRGSVISSWNLEGLSFSAWRLNGEWQISRFGGRSGPVGCFHWIVVAHKIIFVVIAFACGIC